MFGTALVVFREVLEAALIIGIVAAATRGIEGRMRWIVGGVGTGLLGALLVAAGAEAIAGWAEGMGQELFNATILGLAVLMLAWHNIWMTQHGRELAASAKKLGQDVKSGAREMSVVLFVIALAVLREGSETVLFLHGIAASGDNSLAGMATGAAIGVAGGAALGWTLFAGLLRIPLKWFFSATSALVLLLAAGMASQAARFLVQADKLPSLATPLWDTSSLVSNESVLGRVLHGLVGYDAQPSGMQMAFFVAILVAISLGMALAGRREAAPSPSSAPSPSPSP